MSPGKPPPLLTPTPAVLDTRQLLEALHQAWEREKEMKKTLAALDARLLRALVITEIGDQDYGTR